MPQRTLLMLIAIAMAACGLVGGSSECGWGSVRLAFDGHTTLADAGLPVDATVAADELGQLQVTADPVPLPHGPPDFSAASADQPEARMYCFHPDGSNMWLRGPLPSGWSVPN